MYNTHLGFKKSLLIAFGTRLLKTTSCKYILMSGTGAYSDQSMVANIIGMFAGVTERQSNCFFVMHITNYDSQSCQPVIQKGIAS